MTIAQFNRTYPSTISLEQLALINQLQNPDSVMPARFPAKCVTDRRSVSRSTTRLPR
jgi:hypothetical protein